MTRVRAKKTSPNTSIANRRSIPNSASTQFEADNMHNQLIITTSFFAIKKPVPRVVLLGKTFPLLAWPLILYKDSFRIFRDKK